MLKPTVKRNLMLDFIPEEAVSAETVNPNRVFKLNDKEIGDGDIVYVMSRELRFDDNWGLLFAQELAAKHQKELKIIQFLDENLYSKRQMEFLKQFDIVGLESPTCSACNDAGAIIVDFNPMNFSNPGQDIDLKGSLGSCFTPSPPEGEGSGWGDSKLSQQYKNNNIWDLVKNVDCAVFEVDSHNIIPARFISDKQEFSAATLRRKVYSHIAEFLTEYPSIPHPDKAPLSPTSDFITPHPSPLPQGARENINIKIRMHKGRGEAAAFNLNPQKENNEAQLKLQDFIENKLDSYAELRNDPNLDMVSSLSPYLHCGLISAQRVALEVLKANVSRENKEAFLEELIVRKELADNFCLYNKDFKSIKAALPWAKETLDKHRNDIRTYLYTLEEFENAQTHDELWNAAQKQLLKEGRIHGYMRMYWAKKILEWTNSPQEALDIAIYLNDTYALDGNDSNGYVGILWSIAGIHDRAFQERLVTGKIRYMSFNGCKKKFDVYKYMVF